MMIKNLVKAIMAAIIVRKIFRPLPYKIWMEFFTPVHLLDPQNLKKN